MFISRKEIRTWLNIFDTEYTLQNTHKEWPCRKERISSKIRHKTKDRASFHQRQREFTTEKKIG